MSLALDPVLKAAQDGVDHKMIVSLTSEKNSPDIPLDGLTLYSSPYNDISPIVHSSGRICLTYIEQSNPQKIIFAFSDEDRTEFTKVEFSRPYVSLVSVSITEIDDTTIGIIYTTTTDVNRLIISNAFDDAERTSSYAQIFTYSGYFSGPYVIKLQNGTYLMAYAKQPSNYAFYKRTSSDFVTWSDESQINLGTPGAFDMTKKIEYPSLLQAADGSIFLWFDRQDAIGANNQDITNIYYSLSSDNGSSWPLPLALTTYGDFTAKGIYPQAAQKSNGEVYVSWTQIVQNLSMSFSKAPITDLSFDKDDPHGAKLYVTCTYSSESQHVQVFKIDIATWTIEKTWNGTSTPSFITGSANGSDGTNAHAADKWMIPLFQSNWQIPLLEVLDGRNNVIHHYYFRDYEPGSVYKNTAGLPDLVQQWKIMYAKADAINQRIWVLFEWDSYGGGGAYGAMVWGYINFNDVQGENGLYPFTQVGTYNTHLGGATQIEIIPDATGTGGKLIIARSGSYQGLTVIDMATSAIIKNYDPSNLRFPLGGIIHFAYDGANDAIYCSFPYSTAYNNGDKRGLLKIDLETDAMTYFRPPYASVDDYLLGSMFWSVQTDEIFISTGFGPARFDIESQEWTLYGNLPVVGLAWPEMPGGLPGGSIFYDELSDMIYAEAYPSHFTWYGDGYVVGFKRSGSMSEIMYSVGTPAWSWNAPAVLVKGFANNNCSICFDNDILYAFWCYTTDTGTTQLKWDRAIGAFELSGYIADDTDTEYNMSVDNPRSLTFTVTQGHLFDVRNKSSLLSGILQRGRKLTLRVGEKIGGSLYYADQGVYFINKNPKLTYERPGYPNAEISAGDKLELWKDVDVSATEHYQDVYPEPMAEAIVEEFSDFTSADIALPNFDGRSLLDHQFLDMKLYDILKEIFEHYSYFPRTTVDGKLSARKISADKVVNNTPDHVYSDLTKISNFTPDDQYSNNVCKIIVTGYEKSYTEETYSEERVASKSGTSGWWSGHEKFKIYYSEDKTKTCVSPRINNVIKTTPPSIAVNGGLSIEITNIDPDNKWCEVTVSVPPPWETIVEAAGFVGLDLITPDWTIDSPFGGRTIRVGTMLQTLEFLGVIAVLTAVVNWSFEIWAQPTGKVHLQVSDSEEDVDYERILNMEGLKAISQTVEDTLCGTGADCKAVAKNEMFVTSSQRKRVTFTKTAHLQDEEGDLLLIPHPYGRLKGAPPMQIFTTDIKRQLRFGKNGYFRDNFQGWDLTP